MLLQYLFVKDQLPIAVNLPTAVERGLVRGTPEGVGVRETEPVLRQSTGLPEVLLGVRSENHQCQNHRECPFNCDSHFRP